MESHAEGRQLRGLRGICSQRKDKEPRPHPEPDKTVTPADYSFQFDAQTADGKFTFSNKLNVTVQERTAGLEDIQITTSYPVLKGQTDARFEFSLDIMNKSEVDRTFNLAAVAPEKWEINFKPSYEQKQISSLRIKGATSQSGGRGSHPCEGSFSGRLPHPGEGDLRREKGGSEIDDCPDGYL